MVKTKGLTATTKNWEDKIGSVPAAYATGVQAADNVIEKAIASQQLYEDRMQASFANKSRVKGLQKTSTAEWKDKAIKKGAARIAQGMNESKEKFASGMGKVLAVIEATSIAEKTGDVAANVQGRVLPIAQALRNAKDQGQL